MSCILEKKMWISSDGGIFKNVFVHIISRHRRKHLLLEAWPQHLRYKYIRVYHECRKGHTIFIKAVWATLSWITVACLTCEQKSTCTADVLGDKRTYLHTFTHPLKEKLLLHAEISDLCPFNCSCQTRKVVSRIIMDWSLYCSLF